jgi:hypothetical protein
MSTTSADAQNILETEKSMYLEIYLAEFDALSNRLTYWLTLQYAPYGIAAVCWNGQIQPQAIADGSY